MAERAQKVVVRAGALALYSTRFGGQECAEALLHGAAGLREDLDISQTTDEMWDPDFAEGGYLVDFDRECILIYSWDGLFLERVEPRIATAWPGWSVRIVSDGILGFRSYLASIGLPA